MPPKTTIKESKESQESLVIIQYKLDSINEHIANIESDMKTKFATSGEVMQLRREFNELVLRSVTSDQFAPIKTVVYGFIGLVLTGVVGSLLALIYRTKS